MRDLCLSDTPALMTMPLPKTNGSTFGLWGDDPMTIRDLPTSVCKKVSGLRTSISIVLLVYLAACAVEVAIDGPESITITIIGTNDLHGAIVATNGAGGLHIFSGYLKNIRAKRAADGGAVLLIDAGDMWQGTLESNLGEGASVVQAYNALGYTAAAIGNHEFDYGPEGPHATPESADEDGQGALKARAAEAEFSILAANLIDTATGVPVAWPNVSPSIMTEVAGIKVGIIGALTERTRATTNIANISGLSIDPLVTSVTREALQLRQAGAEVVIVAAHAGSACQEFTDPDDLSSCYLPGEVFRLAQGLRTGLVDVIIGGHVHKGIAHNINGLSVISSFSRGLAFGRVDITVKQHPLGVNSKTVYPPQFICEFTITGTSNCANGPQGAARSEYAGSVVTPDAELQDLMRPSIVEALRYKKREIGVIVESTFTRYHEPESALGNLLTDIMLEITAGADVAIHNTVGGIRADLQSGPLTFGGIYELFPFDNQMIKLSVSGAELRKLFTHQFQGDRWAAGVSGMHLTAECRGPQLVVTMIKNNGQVIDDDEQLTLVTTDFLAVGGDNIFVPIMPTGGYEVEPRSPGFRDGIVRWFERHQGTLRQADFYDASNRRFTFPAELPISCGDTK